MSLDDDRIKAIEVNLALLQARQTRTKPFQWEIDRALRQENDGLKLRILDLEKQLDDLIDNGRVYVEHVATSPKSKKHRKKVKQTALERKEQILKEIFAYASSIKKTTLALALARSSGRGAMYIDKLVAEGRLQEFSDGNTKWIKPRQIRGKHVRFG